MQKMMKLLALAIPIVLLCGCYTDNYESLYPTSSCNVDSLTYSGEIKGIFNTNCALSGCHNTATASSGVILDTYTGAKTIATDGRLVSVINHSAGFSQMPKDRPKLDDCTISKLTKWAQNGAPQ